MVVANPTVSVLFGTVNRLPLLRKAIASIPRCVGSYDYEIIVVDGCSVDGSVAWLRSQPKVHVICETSPSGAVRAYNRGWVECAGKYVAHFNDDTEYMDSVLENGIRMLEEDVDHRIGQVAFKFGDEKTKRWRDYKGTLYANYGIARWEDIARVAEKQGGADCFWNPVYQTYGGDVEQSLWMWRLGLQVKLCEWGWVLDHEAQDALRASHNMHADNAKLVARWPEGVSAK